jgi:hypothetical protein
MKFKIVKFENKDVDIVVGRYYRMCTGARWWLIDKADVMSSRNTENSIIFRMF